MRDALAEAMFTPWREKAQKFGIRSSVTVPFKQDDRVIGVILVYAGRADAFGPRELELFCELGAELAFAMSVAENRARLAAAEVGRQAAEDAAREAQSDLARAGRLLSVGEFASSIAHEINQPVAAIITNGDAALRWMDRDPPDLVETRAAVTRMIRDANRAGAVIARTRGLLAKDEPNYVNLDINGVVQEVLAFTRGEQRRAKVSVLTDLTAGLPPVRGDRVQLQQVLLNLVLNALDAMSGMADRARTLRLRSHATADGGVRVEVEDTGSGLDPAGAERLFDHFFTTKPGGIGLGLPISRSIIETLGGQLSAGPAPSGGALFQFTLPAATEPLA
jgi:C4-dicarboxylate-specific signal transduction histidine kinase